MISKQKARRVTVSNNAFRHKVSTTPISKGIYQLNITVQSEIHNASKLIVAGLIQKDSSVWPNTELKYRPTVTRHEVEYFIRDAIDSGWDFEATGSDFTLQASNDVFCPTFWADQLTSKPPAIRITNHQSDKNKANKAEMATPRKPSDHFGS